MVTLEQAQKIVSLFSQLDSVNKRLAEINASRDDGMSISISFKNKNRDGRCWGDVEGLKYSATFRDAGRLNDIAAIVLARLSDDMAARKRAIERQLDELGAARP